jgi:hypothetical protein
MTDGGLDTVEPEEGDFFEVYCLNSQGLSRNPATRPASGHFASMVEGRISTSFARGNPNRDAL